MELCGRRSGAGVAILPGLTGTLLALTGQPDGGWLAGGTEDASVLVGRITGRRHPRYDVLAVGERDDADRHRHVRCGRRRRRAEQRCILAIGEAIGATATKVAMVR